MRVLFVCTGNICRSPTADAILRARVAALGLGWHVDSAGTHGYHIGDPPDSRSVRAAAAQGVDMAGLRARRIAAADFEQYDLILAMDRGHYQILIGQCPPAHHAKIRLFLEESGLAADAGYDVPDPYYGAPEGFERVYDMIARGVEAILTPYNPLKSKE